MGIDVRLEGKVALVTGAAGPLGLAASRFLVEDGLTVVIPHQHDRADGNRADEESDSEWSEEIIFRFHKHMVRSV